MLYEGYFVSGAALIFSFPGFGFHCGKTILLGLGKDWDLA